MRKILVWTLASVLMASCSQDKTGQFSVTGEIQGAEGKMLILENAGLSGNAALDSVRISRDGSFSIGANRPESPEFYRLRLDGKVINLAIDSTETITVKAQMEGFDTKYEVEDSPVNQKIKEINALHHGLLRLMADLGKQYQQGKIMRSVYQSRLDQAVLQLKEQLRKDYILSAPNTMYAYYAVMLQVDGYMIFDAQSNREDVKCFAAVATSYQNSYPGTQRAESLKNIAIRGLKNTYQAAQAQNSDEDIAVLEADQVGIIDILLADIDGKTRKLSDLKGKVVLVDFALYSASGSADHNYALKSLYAKYAASGLEIYQVSLDSDEHFWKTTADNLPWICVRDSRSIYSSLLTTYGVKQIPTMFIVDRQSDLKARSEDISSLEPEIKKYL